MIKRSSDRKKMNAKNIGPLKEMQGIIIKLLNWEAS